MFGLKRKRLAKEKAELDKLNAEVKASVEAEVLKRLPEYVKQHFAQDEAMAILYSIIAIRGKFLFFLANKLTEEPQKEQWWLEQEKNNVIEYLVVKWKDIPKEQIIELVNEFYK